MARPLLRRILFLASIVLAAGAALLVLAYRSRQDSGAPRSIPGVVHETEIRIAPEINGRVASLFVTSGQRVRKGDRLAALDSPELAAAVLEARAATGQARADRAHVIAGVRKEEIDISAQNVQVAEANLALAQQEYKRSATLASSEFASKQKLDESTATLRKAEASLNLRKAILASNQAGPTREERLSADAKVDLADAAAADLEAKLAKTMIVAPVDGRVGLLIAEPGEVVSPGQSIITLEAEGERWFTFTIREDRLGGVAIGSSVNLETAKKRAFAGRVTELRPLGEFATWRAARAVGDHDLNSFLVRIDPSAAADDLEPGMTVWLTP